MLDTLKNSLLSNPFAVDLATGVAVGFLAHRFITPLSLREGLSYGAALGTLVYGSERAAKKESSPQSKLLVTALFISFAATVFINGQHLLPKSYQFSLEIFEPSVFLPIFALSLFGRSLQVFFPTEKPKLKVKKEEVKPQSQEPPPPKREPLSLKDVETSRVHLSAIHVNSIVDDAIPLIFNEFDKYEPKFNVDGLFGIWRRFVENSLPISPSMEQKIHSEMVKIGYRNKSTVSETFAQYMYEHFDLSKIPERTRIFWYDVFYYYDLPPKDGMVADLTRCYASQNGDADPSVFFIHCVKKCEYLYPNKKTWAVDFTKNELTWLSQFFFQNPENWRVFLSHVQQLFLQNEGAKHAINFPPLSQ